ncbi:MAG: 50S ribosomal protein L3 [Phycisphaerales bacterium]|jgi:large subunit ribosomal protein L3|nr:50S ribosomal protein L3 [Phycisphaerales bacterium]
MGVLLIGTKVGMTRVFDDKGVSIPVTAIRIEPNIVTQVRSVEADKYAAVQVASGAIKPRNSTIPLIAHDAKAGAEPKRYHREFRVEAGEAGSYSLGQELGVKDLEGVPFVDVIGVSKGKGFAGVMKRYHFGGLEASHGVERKHRSPGSIGGHATNRGHSGKPKKGKRMAGHMGHERVTVRSLDIVRIDADNHLLLVKGPVPGPNTGMVQVRPAVRLNRSKTRRIKDGK